MVQRVGHRDDQDTVGFHQVGEGGQAMGHAHSTEPTADDAGESLTPHRRVIELVRTQRGDGAAVRRLQAGHERVRRGTDGQDAAGVRWDQAAQCLFDRERGYSRPVGCHRHPSSLFSDLPSLSGTTPGMTGVGAARDPLVP